MPTPQEHIEAIAQATWTVEKLARETKRKAKETQEAVAHLHNLLTAAQQDYNDTHGGITIQSGGTNKPDPNDPPPGDLD